MSKKTNFKKTDLKTEFFSILIFLFFNIIFVSIIRISRIPDPSNLLILLSVIITSAIVRGFRKGRKDKSYESKLNSYNKKLEEYQDFNGFSDKDFDMLFCGYHIFQHGNVKAKIRFAKNQFIITWEDQLRELLVVETVDVVAHKMNQIQFANEFFALRFRELHFSFEWQNLQNL